MILLCGQLAESPLAMVRARLDDAGVSFVALDQQDLAEVSVDYQIDRETVTGLLRVRDSSYALEDFFGVYIRLANAVTPPTANGGDREDHRRHDLGCVYDALLAWCQITPARVVTRPVAAASNASKAYQLQLIRRHGFAVPETLITNDPELVLDFVKCHERVIYKSLSASRSVVRMLRSEDMARLTSIIWCPTQFQEFVEGLNVRVHTLAGECFATAIHTDAVDYRYSERCGTTSVQLCSVALPDDLTERCLRLGEALDLPFAGIDLKIEPSGRAVCFEVNPSPAFTFYEAQTEQPISRALARYLAVP
jgi:RimK-like ATP-grasp domain